MDRIEADLTPAQEWQQSLNATVNRLSTQYGNLLRAASSTSVLQKGQPDPRAGGGRMNSSNDPPPPPLASDVAVSSLQCQLAVENLCVAASQLLSLIRVLRSSILLMDEETIVEEEEWQVHHSRALSNKSQEEANKLELELLRLRAAELDEPGSSS